MIANGNILSCRSRNVSERIVLNDLSIIKLSAGSKNVKTNIKAVTIQTFPLSAITIVGKKAPRKITKYVLSSNG